MRIPRIYADNSVFGGVYDERFAEESRGFFGAVRGGECLILVSQLVLDELAEAPERVQRILVELPATAVEEVTIDDEVQEPAWAYVSAGVLSERRLVDATHVAAATVARADLILSWNFRHLVNLRRIRRFNGVNALHGYQQIEIHSPLEVSYGSEDEDV